MLLRRTMGARLTGGKIGVGAAGTAAATLLILSVGQPVSATPQRTASVASTDTHATSVSTLLIEDPRYASEVDTVERIYWIDPDGSLIASLRPPEDGKVQLSRINVDGTLDVGFAPTVEGNVYGVTKDSTGRLVVRGDFTKVNSQRVGSLVRLNADGTLDPSFQPPRKWRRPPPEPIIGDNTLITSLQSTGNGKYLISGINLTNDPEVVVLRMNRDGSIDKTFKPVTSYGGGDIRLWLQPDGRFYLYEVIQVNGTKRNGFVRMKADGSLDRTFNFDSRGPTLPAGLDARGGIYVSNWFKVNGRERFVPRLLTSSGKVDPVFQPVVSPYVSSIDQQPGGKVIIEGDFRRIDGQSVPGVARLNRDGSLDRTFRSAIGPLKWLVPISPKSFWTWTEEGQLSQAVLVDAP